MFVVVRYCLLLFVVVVVVVVAVAVVAVAVAVAALVVSVSHAADTHGSPPCLLLFSSPLY